MIEIIAGIGIGLWGALAITVATFLYARKHDLLETKRDRFLRGDIDTAYERIEELESEINSMQSAQTDLSLLVNKRLTEIYTALDRGETRMMEKED